MDLTQKKLTKAEWESIETPISESEKKIIKVIMDGYDTVNIRYNENQSMLQILHINSNPEIEQYIFKEYFIKEIEQIVTNITNINKKDKKDKKDRSATPQLCITEVVSAIQTWISANNQTLSSAKKIKKADMFRIQNMSENITNQRKLIFEFLLLEFCEKIFVSLSNQCNSCHGFYLYTLLQFKTNSIEQINSQVTKFVEFTIEYALQRTNIQEVFHQSPEFIERNPYLLKYQDISLFPHQKQLFSIVKSNQESTPKLILYIAPTGTGKTLSPIGLSKKHKIIFVCVARHVGLALAKSAISMHKKVAFAFGCETASDIRLHYFAASSYSIHNKSGGIYKVDNSVGTNVEIMICDVKSYLTAMHYMLAFNDESDIMTYWDEPTITMDYKEHPLHQTIQNNWKENKISKLVLSCATLPKENEIEDTIQDFRCKFDNAEIHSIVSYDCKKTISLLNKEGKCSLPHLLFADYTDLAACVKYCEDNKTLLRYFDLEEIIRYIEYLDKHDYVPTPYKIANYFTSISDITMNSVKLFYLATLSHVDAHIWPVIYTYMTSTQSSKFRDMTVSQGTEGMLGSDLRKVKSLDTLQSQKSLGVPLTRTSSEVKRTESPRHPVGVSGWEPTAPILRDSIGGPERPSILHRLKGDAEKRFLDSTPRISFAKLGNPVLNVSVIPQGSRVDEPLKSVDPRSKGILLTTLDAHTLTDGPTIYLVEDVEKIGKFYIQQSKIPERIFRDIMEKIQENDTVQKKIEALERSLEDTLGSEVDKEKKMEKNHFNKETKEIMNQISILQAHIKTVSMESKYIPNMKQHQSIWIPNGEIVDNAFIPTIEDEVVKEIMLINVENQLKLLLLLGIGVFINQPNIQYMEIMKRMAVQQKLYIIIAQSDYIYGTNYQFCHGFIGKDLTNMTQQKTIQAMGRIGRNNIQQDYTVRFRDDAIIMNLFRPMGENLEAINMSRLFCS